MHAHCNHCRPLCFAFYQKWRKNKQKRKEKQQQQESPVLCTATSDLYISTVTLIAHSEYPLKCCHKMSAIYAISHSKYPLKCCHEMSAIFAISHSECTLKCFFHQIQCLCHFTQCQLKCFCHQTCLCPFTQ